MKTVGVVIINYNGINDTVECINSLFKSKGTLEIKIVVVDNASDNKEGERLKNLYPRIHVINSEKNLGTAGGNNLGIKYLLSQDIDYILILNNDTVVSDDMIDNLIKADNGNCICLPKMYYYDSPNMIWYAGGAINKFTGNAEHYQMNCLDTNKETEVPISCTFATFACVLISKEVISQAGQMDEDYFMYCEDTEFSLRLLSKSIDILCAPKAHLWHKVSRSSGGEGSQLSEYYIARNRFIYLKKYKKFFAFTAFPFTLISRYIRIIQYAILGQKRWKSINKGVRDYFKGVRGKVDKFE